MNDAANDSESLRHFYFLGIRTKGSRVHDALPRWCALLGVRGRLITYDLPRDTSDQDYSQLLQHIRADQRFRGLQITAHKIGIFRSTAVDVLDDDCRKLEEIGAIVRSDKGLRGISPDLNALRDEIPEAVSILDPHSRPLSVAILGGGGAARAMLTALFGGNLQLGRVFVTERDPFRLEQLRNWLVRSNFSNKVGTYDHQRAESLLKDLDQGSLVVNATGVGKDEPGSPIGTGAVLPPGSLAWDLNYRGDLGFLTMARSERHRLVHVRDGHSFFVRNWMSFLEAAVGGPSIRHRFSEFAAVAQ